jgi:uridine phosphorylase
MDEAVNNYDEGIISPLKYNSDPCIAEDAIMVMIPAELKRIVAMAEACKVSFSDGQMYHLFLVRKRGLETGPPIAIAGPFVGAPVAVIGMEKLIVMGAKRIWFFGWCGSIQPELTIGDVIIPEAAFSEEGTSDHYPITDPSPCSDPELCTELEQALKKLDVAFTRGKVWTTDAPYRESRKKVLSYQNQGTLAVEMELSALMTVSAYRSISMAGLLVVSDELFSLKWRKGFSSSRLKASSRAALDLLLLNMVKGQALL